MEQATVSYVILEISVEIWIYGLNKENLVGQRRGELKVD